MMALPINIAFSTRYFTNEYLLGANNDVGKASSEHVMKYFTKKYRYKIFSKIAIIYLNSTNYSAQLY